MKELFKSSPLILFLGLLLILSISIYFGNRTTISEGFTPKDAGYKMTPAEIICYNNRYPDLNKAFNSNAEQLQQHWTNHGAKEGRNNQCNTNPKDPDYQMTPAEIICYNNRYPDLNNAFKSNAKQLQEHWTNNGAKEGRNNQCKATPKDPDYKMTPAEIMCYNNRYPDLNNAFKSNAQQLQQHWTNHGAAEKRNNQCDITPAPITVKPTIKPVATTVKPTIKPVATTANPTTKSTLDPKMANDIRTILSFMKESTSPSSSSSSSSSCGDSKSESSAESDTWFKYWEHVAKSNDPGKFSSSNMIPKTQVVPPICPNCATSSPTSTTAPSSCSGGACTSCGGFGGNGTTMSHNNRFSDFIAKYGPGYQGEGKWSGYGGTKSTETSKDTKTSTEKKSETTDENSLAKFAKDAGSGAKDLLQDTGSGATGLLKDSASGATGLLRDSASGATGLLRDTASGATGLLKETGSGIAGLLKSSPTQLENKQQNSQTSSSQSSSGQGYNNPYQTGYYSQGVYNLPNNPLGIQGVDPYSYNGALVSKGSNYIPVTSDFSSFRK